MFSFSSETSFALFIVIVFIPGVILLAALFFGVRTVIRRMRQSNHSSIFKFAVVLATILAIILIFTVWLFTGWLGSETGTSIYEFLT